MNLETLVDVMVVLCALMACALIIQTIAFHRILRAQWKKVDSFYDLLNRHLSEDIEFGHNIGKSLLHILKSVDPKAHAKAVAILANRKLQK